MPSRVTCIVALFASVVVAIPAPQQTANETSLVPRSGGVACPPNFRNVVFNGPTESQPDWSTRFKNIQTIGKVDKWIGFTAAPPHTTDPNILKTQIPLLMNPDEGYLGCNLQHVGVMQYTITFNEPDFALTDGTDQACTSGGVRSFDAATAAAGAAKIFAAGHPANPSGLISPGVAFPGNTWLKDFFNACNCMDKYHAIALHLYDKDYNSAIQTIKNTAAQFGLSSGSKLKMWITEMAPASSDDQGCTLDQAGVQTWMTQVLQFAAQSGYVERIFWNFGEAAGPGDPLGTVCSAHLTNMDGSGTPILDTLGSICSD